MLEYSMNRSDVGVLLNIVDDAIVLSPVLPNLTDFTGLTELTPADQRKALDRLRDDLAHAYDSANSEQVTVRTSGHDYNVLKRYTLHSANDYTKSVTNLQNMGSEDARQNIAAGALAVYRALVALELAIPRETSSDLR